jgi:hypothetical protein
MSSKVRKGRPQGPIVTHEEVASPTFLEPVFNEVRSPEEPYGPFNDPYGDKEIESGFEAFRRLLRRL